MFQIWEVVEKHNATIAMLLDWFCNIFDFVINFSLSFPNGVKSKYGLALDLRVIGLGKLNDGISYIPIKVPHQLNVDVSLRCSLLHAHLRPSSALTFDHIVVLFFLNPFQLKFLFLIPSKCHTIDL